MKKMQEELTSFNKRMEKTMDALTVTFNDGIRGVGKLQAETSVVQALFEQKNKQDAQNIEKVNSGIANLEMLTSDLKNSFGDEKSEAEEKPVKKSGERHGHRDKALVQTQSMNK